MNMKKLLVKVVKYGKILALFLLVVVAGCSYSCGRHKPGEQLTGFQTEEQEESRREKSRPGFGRHKSRKNPGRQKGRMDLGSQEKRRKSWKKASSCKMLRCPVLSMSAAK